MAHIDMKTWNKVHKLYRLYGLQLQYFYVLFFSLTAPSHHSLSLYGKDQHVATGNM